MYSVLELRAPETNSAALEDETLIGYVIMGDVKLKSINVYDDLDEAQAEVDSLNEAELLRAHWPMPDDPEVVNLLNDPNFEPVEYDEVEVPDYENSKIIYVLEEDGRPRVGPDGRPVVNWVDSEIVTKVERQPRRTDQRSRVDAACEAVARKRAGGA